MIEFDIRINEVPYRTAHDAPPRGFKRFAFSIDEAGIEAPVASPHMRYRDAVQWIRVVYWARFRGRVAPLTVFLQPYMKAP